ncbi:AzlD domain-containing protein [Nocardioides sp. SYSU D00038]|uniref:AzlD domain-containing protein n=1 Tax=Nocardioides sp. SYSU D00038 TaxID=2812554 RepID=UPI001967A9B3|nr:AzlD domain-containing protein [Nocardioides sp. SYSU D00038]
MNLWVLIGVVAVLTVVLRALGPVVLGGRDLPSRFDGVIVLLAGPLLAALVVASALAEGRQLQVDSSTAGVAVGGVLLWRDVHVVVAVVVAAAVTAGLRAVGLP